MTSAKIPILLLKTKSTPNDSYEEHFCNPTSPFTPIFVPVLEHKPNVPNLEIVKTLLRDGQLDKKYGGMIFTSQRAVEGFAQAVQELEGERVSVEATEENRAQENSDRDFGMTKPSSPSLSTPVFPLYTVGPATSRTLNTLLSTSPSVLSPLHPQIMGSDTGNGEALAYYILQNYSTISHSSRQQTARTATPLTSENAEDGDNHGGPLPPLLFLVGEQRRDVIPKTLNSDSLPQEQRIRVDELVVYETNIMESFPENLDRALQTHQRAHTTSEDMQTSTSTGSNVVIIVVFSPSGCQEMLRRLGLLDGNRQIHPTASRLPSPKSSSKSAAGPRGRYVIATIGPTTYKHLATEFGFQADVCAKRPSPEGIREGVEAYLRARHLLSV